MAKSKEGTVRRSRDGEGLKRDREVKGEGGINKLCNGNGKKVRGKGYV